MKTQVCLLCGGRSSEHEVSLVSASHILHLLRKIPAVSVQILLIDKKGAFFEYQGPDENLRDEQIFSERELLSEVYFKPGERAGYWTENPEGRLSFQPVDIFFPVLHGRFGEDGTVQSLFELMNAPYVGCQVLSSALMMDKESARCIFSESGIPMTPAISLLKREDLKLPAVEKRIAAARLNYPLFVKPANAGSSVGISKVHKAEELSEALRLAFAHDEKILIEEGVEGREIELAVLQLDPDGRELLASRPGEIIPGREFYDYEDKYDAGSSSRILIPADLSKDKLEEFHDLALRAFRAGGCRGLARVDFFIRSSDEKVLLNEINTMPGFTPISMYPKLIENAGISGQDLMEILLRQSLA